MQETTNFKPRYMMATKAMHQLGDLSRDVEDICYVKSEDDENYIGSWIFGLGFFNVKFPKITTRELTKDDVDKYSGMKVAMVGSFSGKHSWSSEIKI